MRYFIGLYAAHLCGDVLAYFPALAQAKRASVKNHKILAIAIHCVVHSVFILFWFFVLHLDHMLFAVTYIFLVHFMIDLFRIYWEEHLFGEKELLILKRGELFRWMKDREKGDVHHFMRRHFRKWISLNIIDQSLHLVSIGAWVYWIV